MPAATNGIGPPLPHWGDRHVLPFFITLATLFVVFAAACVVLWLIYAPIVARIMGECPYLAADHLPPLHTHEVCEFATTDGLTLRGSYLRTTAARRLGVVAFSHELHGDRRGAGAYLEGLRLAGFDVLTFDYRNHGQSDRQVGYRPVQWLTRYEVDDLRAAVDYLAGRVDRDPSGVGLFGVSRGGAAALYVAAHDARVRAVVTDGAYPNDGMHAHYFHRYVGIYRSWTWFRWWAPQLALDALVMWARVLLNWREGFRLASVEAAAPRIRQPVLMIHGARDRMIPLTVVRRLRQRLAGTSKLWVVPGARHNMARTLASKEYERRVTLFFVRHLAGQSWWTDERQPRASDATVSSTRSSD